MSNRDWPVEFRLKFLGENSGSVGLQNIGDENSKFITAGARQGVCSADYFSKPRCHLAQEIIANSVSVGIVDLFKSVEVHYQDRCPRMIAFRAFQHIGHAIFEETPVGQALSAHHAGPGVPFDQSRLPEMSAKFQSR